MNGMKILCVENQPECMALLTSALEGIGYEVMAASDERQALELFTRQPIDGVLLESDLPEATGGALRTKLKAIHPDIPILLFAGISSQTPFMLRFLDAYLRNTERYEDS